MKCNRKTKSTIKIAFATPEKKEERKKLEAIRKRSKTLQKHQGDYKINPWHV